MNLRILIFRCLERRRHTGCAAADNADYHTITCFLFPIITEKFAIHKKNLLSYRLIGIIPRRKGKEHAMNRRSIEKIAKSPEDRVLLSRLWDKITAGMDRNVPASTCFLSPREQEMARYLFGEAEGLHFFGGFDDAERNMLVYLPEYLDEWYLMGEDSPIVCLHAQFYEGDSPSHRDFLGALMGIGIGRETIGDICVGKEHCDFFVTAEIAPYLLQNLASAGRAKLRLNAIPLAEASIPQPEIEKAGSP